MTPKEALRIVCEAASDRLKMAISNEPERRTIISSAITALQNTRVVAVPEGHHVYTSRFKMGEIFWTVRLSPSREPYMVRNINYEGLGEPYINGIPESDCFPTREEAEAEAQKRNAER